MASQGAVKEQEQGEQGTEAEVTTEAADNSAEGGSVKDEKPKPKPVYASAENFTVLDELPADEPAGNRGRDKVYFAILEAIASDQDHLGKYHEVVYFPNDNGAHNVATQLTKQVEGKVLTEEQAKVKATDRPAEVKGFILPNVVKEIPDYTEDGWSWEFTSRRVAARHEGAGAEDRGSVLYARLRETAEIEAEKASQAA